VSSTRAALAALLAVFAVVVVANAATYPPGRGYDAHWHEAYVEGLRERRELPREGEYYTPPGFYTVAAAAMWTAEQAGVGEPRRAVQLLNGLLALGTAVLLLLLARTLFPGREVLHVAAVGAFALGAWAAKAAAMFHPETLDLFLCTLALLLVTRMLAARRFSVPAALALGLVLGAAQLVRAFSLWTVAVAVFGLLAAALVGGAGRRRAPLVAAGAAVAASLVLAGPWYVRQAVEFSDPIFAPPAPQEPLWQRRPPAFYLDPGLPEVITAPHRPNFVNRFLPQLYADAWGDYFGFFGWDAQERRPSPAERRQLSAQSIVGLVPTGLALAGWIALLVAAARRRPELVPVALLPLAGIAGMLYFTVSYPTPDGDVIKAQYMLTTAPAWALAFGYAVDRLWRGRALRLALAVALVPAAVVSWAFSVYALGPGP